MVSAFLLIYYTDVAGISAATAGTLFLVVRIWGGVTDLLAGRRVDETSTRWGRFRPYLLFGSVPLLVLLVAVFSIPSGLSDDGQDRLGARLLRAVPAGLQLRQHPLRLAGRGDDAGARRAGQALDRQGRSPPASRSC